MIKINTLQTNAGKLINLKKTGMATEKCSSSSIKDLPSMPIIDNDDAVKKEDLNMDNTSAEHGGTVKTVNYIGPDIDDTLPKEVTSSDLYNNDLEENEDNTEQVTNSYSSPKVISGKNLSMMRQQCNLTEAGTSGSVHKKSKKHKKRVRKHKCKGKLNNLFACLNFWFFYYLINSGTIKIIKLFQFDFTRLKEN